MGCEFLLTRLPPAVHYYDCPGRLDLIIIVVSRAICVQVNSFGLADGIVTYQTDGYFGECIFIPAREVEMLYRWPAF